MNDVEFVKVRALKSFNSFEKDWEGWVVATETVFHLIVNQYMELLEAPEWLRPGSTD